MSRSPATFLTVIRRLANNIFFTLSIHIYTQCDESDMMRYESVSARFVCSLLSYVGSRSEPFSMIARVDGGWFLLGAQVLEF